MSDNLDRYHDYARFLLAGVRLFYGAIALFAPSLIAGQLGVGPKDSNRAIIYVLRLFGVRTIVVGVELLVQDEQVRANALRYAVPIHASDTIAAALVGIQGQVPARTSIMLTVISAINTALAIFAQPHKD